MQFLLRIRNKFFLVLVLVALIAPISEASTLVIRKSISWTELENATIEGQQFSSIVTFPMALLKAKNNYLPFWAENIRLNKKAVIRNVTIANIQYGNFKKLNAVQNQDKVTGPNVQFTQFTEDDKAVASVIFCPLSNNGGAISPITSFDVVITYDEVTTSLAKKAFVSNSLLAQGNWFKLGVTKTGFHRIDKAYLEGLGIDLGSLDPRTLKIYGYGAGVLAQPVSAARFDDLVENTIIVNGESDGKFDAGDVLLFYARSQFDVWKNVSGFIQREKNIYSDTTYYYLTFGQTNGLRVTKQASQPAAVNTENTHIFCHAHEQELTNVGRTGRQFVGEAFDRLPSQQFSLYIDGLQTTESLKMRSAVAARSFITASKFDISVNGGLIFSHANIPTVGTSYDSYYFSNSGPVIIPFTSASSQLAITYTYNSPPGGAIGWLDFFEINAKAKMNWSATQTVYRVLAPTVAGATEYTISGLTGSSARVFDVTNPTQITELITTTVGNQVSFINNTTDFREFTGISTGSSFWVPANFGKVANQNLHALTNVDALYITPVLFYNEALRLAAFHQSRGVNVKVVKTDEIYNEFSSGSQDITAIREFIRSVYNKGLSGGVKLKYVTIFGRASYDYKARINNNTNFVPTYQSVFSESPIGSYCSDDFYGLLEDGDGKWETGSDAKESLEIGIGRLPISNETEAAIAVDKIINYHKPDRMGDWRNKLVFIADDEDYRIHQVDANFMSSNVSANYPNLNVQKIWIDAYKQEVVAGGERYPSAQKAINDAVQKGCFIVNYTGHGGELGWAAERILTIEDINSWTNEKSLPLFITATCEFSRFDDPARVSAGELVFLNQRGGAIALFTTVRLVLAFSNTVLNTALYNRIGFDSLSKATPKSLGQIMKETKNDYASSDGNERNFTLLGDAVMSLAYPKYNVATTSINNKPMASVTDTLKALSKVTINGVVQDLAKQTISTYNGELQVVVYDKPETNKTLVNDPTSAPSMLFTMQNNIIYSGSASVVNGAFSFSFVVPKDISYDFGKGKISYYAFNQDVDANGNNSDFVVGGTSDSIVVDNVGPSISLFMDDYSFVNGGLTSENTLFIAKLFDENGINTIGRGVGRELSLVIDGDQSKAMPVNDYYKAKLNSYQEGEVRYKLNNLSVGKHTATLRAWDTHNKSSEMTTEFIVASSEAFALKHVLNYPNPFNNFTTFHFDHNRVGEVLTVMVQVYTISGKLVKTLSTQVSPANSHFDQLTWNGLDDYGDKLANGVYIYKVKVQGQSGKSVDATQKMVILN